MKVITTRFSHLIVTIFLLFGLLGCKSVQDQMLEDLTLKAKNTNLIFGNFLKKVEGKKYSNVLILNTYGQKAKQYSPDFSKAIDLILKEGTVQGTQIKDFKNRLKSVNLWLLQNKDALFNEALYNKESQEIMAIRNFSTDYNSILIDSINVIAGLSNGKLEKIEYPESKKGTKNIAGSEYIGNPSFGRWKNESSGNSFWEWYGMYSMFGHIFSPTPVYRSSWYSGHGGYSYFDRSGYAYQPRSYQNSRTSYYKPSTYLSTHSSAMNKVSPKFRTRMKSNTFSSRNSTGSSKSYSSKGSNTFRSSSRSSRSFGGGGK